MEAFWGFTGIGVCAFLCLFGYSLVVKAHGDDKKESPSEEED